MFLHSAVLTHLESEDGVDGEVGEVLDVVREDLGAEGSAGDVQQVHAELLRVIPDTQLNTHATTKGPSFTKQIHRQSTHNIYKYLNSDLSYSPVYSSRLSNGQG